MVDNYKALPYNINILRKVVLIMDLGKQQLFIEFSEGDIQDDGYDHSRKTFTNTEKFSDFLNGKYGEALCTNGNPVPVFIEASSWAELACIDETATFDVDNENESWFEVSIRSMV